MTEDRTTQAMNAMAKAVNEWHRKQVEVWTRFAKAVNEAFNQPR